MAHLRPAQDPKPSDFLGGPSVAYRPSPRAAVRLATALLMAVSCACGGHQDDPDRAGSDPASSTAAGAWSERLLLTPLEEAIRAREPKLLWSWNADQLEPIDGWEIEEGLVLPVERESGDLLFVDRKVGKLEVRIPLDVPASGAWVLEVDAINRDLDLILGVAIERADERRTLGRRFAAVDPEVAKTRIELGRHGSPENELENLLLRIPEGQAPFALYGLRLYQVSVDNEFDESAFGDFELIRLEGTARRATVLRSEHPVFGSLQSVPKGARLRFEYTIPKSIDSKAEGRSLRFKVEGEESGRVLSEEISIPSSQTPWTVHEVDLSKLAGEPVYFEYEYQAQGPDDLLALAQPTCSVPEASPRTVLLITSDTHRADHLGFLSGEDFVRTRAIDNLASRGMAFLDVSASANNTTPSHVSLLTGLSPNETKLVSNGTRLSESARTLAEIFADNGYTTLAAVSALPVFYESTNLGQGFDEYSIPDEGPLRDGGDSVEALLAALERHRDRPVFAWLHIYDAHAPYTPPANLEHLYYDEGRDPYDAEAPDAQPESAPYWNQRIADPAYTEALYRSEVTYVDGVLAPLLSLDRVRSGWVALTSDHGEVLSRGSDGLFNHDGLSWSTLAVPLILAGPGVPEGATQSEQALQIDTGRTLLDLAGLDTEPFPGKGLLDADFSPHSDRFALEANGLGATIVRDKYLLKMDLRPRAESKPGSKHRVRLFDITEDPYGERDIHAEEFATTTLMRARLIEWLLSSPGSNLCEALEGDSSDVQRQLAELGYANTGTLAAQSWIEVDCRCNWCQKFQPE